jgi:hypothetical protein
MLKSSGRSAQNKVSLFMQLRKSDGSGDAGGARGEIARRG